MSPTANSRIDYKTVLAERNAALNTTDMPTVTLASGHTMPVVAYGTFRASPGESYESVLAALHVGYRHFDLAHVYGNEHEIGTAFANAFSNNIVQRSDLFITGKLWNSDHDVDIVPHACQHSLRNLQLDYFDLYLIHFPVAWKHTGLVSPSWGKSEFGDTPLIDTWRGKSSISISSSSSSNNNNGLKVQHQSNAPSSSSSFFIIYFIYYSDERRIGETRINQIDNTIQ